MTQSEFIAWVVLPLMIFLARIIDVSMGTVRIILISKGYRGFAAMLGFFEVLLWITTVGELMKRADSFYYYIAYGAGFAAGTYLGMFIEQKLSLGMVMIRVVTKFEATELMNHIMQKRYSVTVVDGKGKNGDVKIFFVAIKRRDLREVIRLINIYNPNAFYSVEDIRQISGGVMPIARHKEFGIGNFIRFNFAKKK
jgi:uncharacterized protein YebE (UPF0316 family)